MLTVADLVFIDSTGYHFADFPTFLLYLQQQYQGIYGADVYLEPDSQDGQLLSVFAQALFDVASVGSSTYNSFSPATAQGTGLSRNVKINGLTRKSPSNSTVDITIVGQAGTVITNGVVQDTLSQKWDVPTTTIPGGGSITVTATAQEVGAQAAAANTVTTIFTPTLGWQTVTNTLAATPGAPVESDAELRVRQSVSTSDPSLTVLDGTTGAIANLPGVQKVQPYENDTGTDDANDIPGHSICMVVLGGDDVAIAEEIALHKTPGCGTFGNTSETVTDAHGMPLIISFQRPTPATIDVVIDGGALAGWSTDFIPEIQQAVADYLNSLPIGAVVYQSQIYRPAYLIGNPNGSTYNIATITIAKNGGSPVSTSIALNFDENPVCVAASDVTVTIS
jgi:uncharacterized phage protein gp47/JayE